MRQLKPIAKRLYLGAVSIGICFFAAWVFFPQYVVKLAAVNLSFFAYMFAIFMPLVFLIYPATKKAPQEAIPWYDILLAILAFGGFIWAGFYALEAQYKAWPVAPSLLASLVGIIIWGLTIEAARRAGGLIFAGVVLIVSFLPYFAPFLPGSFEASQYPLLRTPAFYLFDHTAIFGLPVKALCRFVVGYLIFGCFLQFMGGGEYLIKMSLAAVGGIRGATAKVSIIASGLFGMLSGSAIANTVTTGTVTIPAMKKSGYPPYYAAAVEASASSGGAIMPPVMGTVAFIMAELTMIPYSRIALAAFIPGFLYFLALFIQSDFQSVKLGIKPLAKEQRPKFGFKLFLEGWVYFAAAAVLVYFIFGPQLASEAPYFALLPLFIGGVIQKKLTSMRDVYELISRVGALLVSMVGLFAALGLITGSFIGTGFGLAISAIMYRLGAGNVLLLILLAGFVAMILGMGIATPAVYILVSIFMCPALVKLGLNIMAVHLFVVYYATVQAITPPVCLTTIVAAKIAGEKGYFKTGFQAMRLGIVMFLVPLYFVHKPALLLQGTALETVICLATVIFAIIMLGAGFERYMYGVGKITIPEAIATIISGFLIILPLAPVYTRIGWVLAAVMIAYWLIKFLFKKVAGA